jgi:hypothetical protein
MLSFELRQEAEGHFLRGGQLDSPLNYADRESAVRLLGFLSQQKGSELLIYGSDGQLTETERREPMVPLGKDSMGAGLSGPSNLGN